MRTREERAEAVAALAAREAAARAWAADEARTEAALAAERARAEAAEAALAAEAVELDRAVEHVRALLSVAYGHRSGEAAGCKLGICEAAEAWLAELDAGKDA
jgi:hypothetical protein